MKLKVNAIIGKLSYIICIFFQRQFFFSHQFRVGIPYIAKMPGFMSNMCYLLVACRITFYKTILYRFFPESLAYAGVGKMRTDKINIRRIFRKVNGKHSPSLYRTSFSAYLTSCQNENISPGHINMPFTGSAARRRLNTLFSWYFISKPVFSFISFDFVSYIQRGRSSGAFAFA